MNSFLAIYSPKWREKNCPRVLNPAFSPISRQSGEKKYNELLVLCKGITEGLIGGGESKVPL